MLNKIFTFILIIFIFSCSYKNISYSTGPDLIIQSAVVSVRYEDGHDQTGMPVQTPYKMLYIILRIKNIGREPFNSSLYVASTSSEEDFKLNKFTSFKLFEPDPVRILPDEVIEFEFTKRVPRSSSHIKFQVNFHSTLENIAKETDYFNNVYSVNY
ncbi:hypothetical protein [Ignavibacterium sp.]|uniref:hypothetical protein n=1 Tax=Ignavibacterium sp. TaxID=2651167 RepID=UPI002209B36B|nr:hypothetical protein [Ignavibacterium sp.]BDQ02647.1 MAG: hypothetical protein KatS3mg037_1222 [Ignavibacterium sp.]